MKTWLDELCNLICSIVNFLNRIGFNRCYSFAKVSFSCNAYIPDDKTIVALSRSGKKFYKGIASRRLHSPSVVAYEKECTDTQGNDG